MNCTTLVENLFVRPSSSLQFISPPSLNPQSEINNPPSAILNPRSAIVSPHSSINNPQSAIALLNHQSEISNPQSLFSILNTQSAIASPQSSISSPLASLYSPKKYFTATYFPHIGTKYCATTILSAERFDKSNHYTALMN